MTAQELDAAVAERVMGQLRPQAGPTVELAIAPNGGWWAWDGKWQPQPYSQDISWAWRVVEKMRELGWGFWLENMWNLLDPPKPGKTWMACFARDIRSKTAHFGQSDNPAEAICCAALKAKEDTCSNHP